jgi:signal transduction histidine kinase
MTAAFAAVTAVAAVAVVGLALMTRRALRERSRREQIAVDLGVALQGCRQSDDRAEVAERAMESAIERSRAAQADAAAAQADAAAAQADAACSKARLVAAESLWELERIRLERECAELAGGLGPLPEPWDGTLRPAIAAELEIVREVVGIPVHLAAGSEVSAMHPLDRLGASRVVAEALRNIARFGEQIDVSLGLPGALTMTVTTDGIAGEPDLTRLAAAAETLGLALTMRRSDYGFEAHLSLPTPG